VLLADMGVDFLLIILIVSSLLGAWITWQFRIETTGVSLEKIGR
jgi:putative MFS transporter